MPRAAVVGWAASATAEVMASRGRPASSCASASDQAASCRSSHEAEDLAMRGCRGEGLAGLPAVGQREGEVGGGDGPRR